MTAASGPTRAGSGTNSSADDLLLFLFSQSCHKYPLLRIVLSEAESDISAENITVCMSGKCETRWIRSKALGGFQGSKITWDLVKFKD